MSFRRVSFFGASAFSVPQLLQTYSVRSFSSLGRTTSGRDECRLFARHIAQVQAQHQLTSAIEARVIRANCEVGLAQGSGVWLMHVLRCGVTGWNWNGNGKGQMMRAFSALAPSCSPGLVVGFKDGGCCLVGAWSTFFPFPTSAP